MKTEAERRLDRFLNAADVLGVRISMNAKEATALFSAIFDPLPPEPEPEPEPVKTLGQVAWEAVPGRGVWSALRPDTRNDWDRSAKAVIAAHESRRQKPTVDEVARVLRDNKTASGLARAVFPLFGVKP